MKRIILAFLLLVVTGAIQSQILNVPAQYPSIQEAINAASDGSTVLVAAGTYNEQINFKGKAITVASLYLTTSDTNYINQTIIDGSYLTPSDSSSLVYFINNEDTTSLLYGFTLQNGKGTSTTESGQEVRMGGAIFISFCGPKIMSNKITGNELNMSFGSPVVVTGGGIGCKKSSGYDSSNLIIENNQFIGNKCFSTSSEASAAGVRLSCNARISGNYFYNNKVSSESTAYSIAGGILVNVDTGWVNQPVINITGNIFSHDSTVSQNNFSNCPGIFVWGSKVLMEGNLFTENFSESNDPNWGGPTVLTYYTLPETIIRNNIFEYNKTNAWAGGLGCEANNDITEPFLVENNYFRYNEAHSGGGFCTLNCPVILQNNVFYGNHSSVLGGAVFSRGDLERRMHILTLINNSFCDNSAAFHGGAIYSNMSFPLLLNNVLWADSSLNPESWEMYLISIDTASIGYCDVNPAYIRGKYIDLGGNINANPVFDNDSLLPAVSSPCINAGIDRLLCQWCSGIHYAPPTDIRDTIRPLDELYDMGAYEVLYPEGVLEKTENDFMCSAQPNPFKTSTAITWEQDNPSSVILTIVDFSGKEIFKYETTASSKGTQQMHVSGNDFPAGVYIYRLQTGEGTATGRLVKY